MKRGAGILLIIAGAVFLLNSFGGLTGFAILSGVGKGAGSLIGVALILVGIILASSKGYEEGEGRYEAKRGRDKPYSEREAEQALRWQYKEDHDGDNPSRKELREFSRDLDSGDIEDIVEDWKEAKHKK